MPPGGGDWLHPGQRRQAEPRVTGRTSHLRSPRGAGHPHGPVRADSHGHLKLLHPFPLHVLCLAEKLEALLALQVNEIEAVGPLRGDGSTLGTGAGRHALTLVLGCTRTRVCMYTLTCTCPLTRRPRAPPGWRPTRFHSLNVMPGKLTGLM